MEEGSLSNLTVPELQQECKKRGLKKNGVKAKLIQRLSEYIEKFGPDHIEPAEKVAPAVVTSVEKSVIAIHNPHPYMEEYEESLIQGVELDNTMEDEEIDSYFPTKRKEEANEYAEDLDTPDSDQPIPYPVRGRNEPEDDLDDKDELQAGSPTYPATGNKVRDARDEAEELTEPIHKSPSYDDSTNGRIVELPTPTEDEGNSFEAEQEVVEEEEDSPKKIHSITAEEIAEDESKKDDEDDAQENVEDHTHREQETPEEPMDELSGDVNGALHRDADDGLDNREETIEDNVIVENDTEENRHSENGEEQNEYNEESPGRDNVERGENDHDNRDDHDDHDDREEENEFDRDQEDNQGTHDEEYEPRKKSRRNKEEEEDENEAGVEEGYDDHASKERCEDDRVEEEEEEEEEQDKEEHDKEEHDREEQVEGMEDYEREEKEEGEVSIEDGEVSRDDSEEMQPEEAIEDGEIVLNVDGQNDFDEHHGDDHLDVSVQDEKISDDHEMDDVSPTPKPKKVVVPVTLKKRISLAASSETLEERAAKRKRRWGSTTTARKDSDVAISSEFIKKLIPDMKIDAAAIESVPELDYQEDDNENAQLIPDDAPEEEGNTETATPPKVFKGGRNVKVDSGKKITLDKPINTTNEVVDVESESDVATPCTPAPPPPKPSIRNYVIDDEVEVQESREKSPSPALNPVSLYLLIKNLVRPFTVNQLKSVISRSGHIQDGGFWINNIKTHCYVKLSTEAEASATRDALHGLRWPAGSPKLLDIDFAINEQMYKETTGLLGQKPKVVIEIEDKDSDILITEERKRKDPKEDTREKDTERRKKRPPSKEEKGKDKDKKEAGREESPAKLLDDLFRKTKATPCIYWLPLTEEQILKLEESRR